MAITVINQREIIVGLIVNVLQSIHEMDNGYICNRWQFAENKIRFQFGLGY